MDTPDGHSALTYSYLKQKCTEHADIGLGHGVCKRVCLGSFSVQDRTCRDWGLVYKAGVKVRIGTGGRFKQLSWSRCFPSLKKGDGIKTSPTQVDLNMAWSQEVKVIVEPMKWSCSLKCPPVFLLLGCGRVRCDPHGITADAMDASESWSMGAALATLCHTLSWGFLESNLIIVPCKAIPDTTKSHN